jgi:putative FmdB family regulatory protein
MPTYGYQCTQCDNQFEIVQRISDDPLSKCDKCGGLLRKKIFPVGIAFKGTGFYVNDYASKPAQVKSAETTTASSDTKANTDSKPAESGTKAESATPAATTPAATSSETAKPAAPAAK